MQIQKTLTENLAFFGSFVNFCKFYTGCTSCAADDLNLGQACWLFRNGEIVLYIVIVAQAISKRGKKNLLSKNLSFSRKMIISMRNEREDRLYI